MQNTVALLTGQYGCHTGCGVVTDDTVQQRAFEPELGKTRNC
jgi:hypothetical protein